MQATLKKNSINNGHLAMENNGELTLHSQALQRFFRWLYGNRITQFFQEPDMHKIVISRPENQPKSIEVTITKDGYSIEGIRGTAAEAIYDQLEWVLPGKRKQ